MMKALKVGLAVAAMLAVIGAATPASAHGYYRGGGSGYWGGPRVSFYYGGPAWWGVPYYYGAPYGYGYGPPVVAAPPAPPVYIERGDQVLSTAPPAPASPPAASTPAGQWWYLCSSPRGAYPYVRECPGGWERVPAVPPGEAR